MTEIIQIVQLIFSVLIVPVLGYVVRLERRLTKLECIIEMYYKPWSGEERRKKP